MDNRMRESSEPEEVLPIDQEAHEIIYGDRESTYGHPSKNLQLIADFWSSYLGLELPLTCDDVCNMMILMKTARLKNMPDHRDSLVDTIGYTLLKERCREVVAPVNEVQREIDKQAIARQHVIDIDNAMMGIPPRSTTNLKEESHD